MQLVPRLPLAASGVGGMRGLTSTCSIVNDVNLGSQLRAAIQLLPCLQGCGTPSVGPGEPPATPFVPHRAENRSLDNGCRRCILQPLLSQVKNCPVVHRAASPRAHCTQVSCSPPPRAAVSSAPCTRYPVLPWTQLSFPL